MKTIFDFNPTYSEIIDLLGENISIEEYSASFNQDDSNTHLCFLMYKRGNLDKYNEYLSFFSPQDQLDIERTVSHN